ncbi:hypothetical protein F8388_006741 [Cannabis sativa]|uniref:RNase H type-1 domain-containing protein n=1 Tax=Cannabis sativa TaxID=3483 RepID=A0A7J6HS94_CANSA|nr:hypothetical protein F8388_006741 [Cannabis sativa]KAF4397875.1 hypothetical protein G4B88_019596 [Cannabis sativa]
MYLSSVYLILFLHFQDPKYWENGINFFWNPESPKSLSFGARSILASRDLIRKESCFLIANGRSTNMWHAPWIPWLDWDHFRVAFNPMIVSNSTLVSSLLNEDREWDFQQTATWMVPSVASSLNLIPMIPNNNDDKLIWKDATSGEFSPRVAYKSIIKGRRAEKDPIWDILPFGERLQRIFGNDVVCAICDEQEDFVLLEPTPLMQHGNFEVEEFRKFGVSLCFILWSVRNQAYHDHVQPSFFITFNQIKSLVAELNSALTTPQDTSLGQSTLNVMQGLLQEDFVVFVDAACKDLRSAAGIIVTKSDSEFVEAFSVQLQATLPLEAEAWALLHTVHWCLIQGWHNVTFAVDCQPLVQGIKSRKTLDWRVAGVFARILDSLDRIPSATVSWIPRSGNEKAHKLAKRSFNSYRFGFFNAEELAPLVAI